MTILVVQYRVWGVSEGEGGATLSLSGGNVEGASGTFGCEVYSRPVTVIVR